MLAAEWYIGTRLVGLAILAVFGGAAWWFIEHFRERSRADEEYRPPEGQVLVYLVCLALCLPGIGMILVFPMWSFIMATVPVMIVILVWFIFGHRGQVAWRKGRKG